MIKVANLAKNSNPFISQFFINGDGYKEIIKISDTNSLQVVANKIKDYLSKASSANILINFDEILVKENEQFNNLYKSFIQKYKIKPDKIKTTIKTDNSLIKNDEQKAKISDKKLKDENLKNEKIKNEKLNDKAKKPLKEHPEKKSTTK